MKSILIMNTVITEKTAKAFLQRMCNHLMIAELTVESSLVLSDIESQLVSNGFFDWEEIEQIEIEAIA